MTSGVRRRLVSGALAAVVGAVLALPVGAQSTIRTEVDTTLVTVGDRITLTVSINHPPGARVEWPDSASLAPFEVLDARVLPTEAAGNSERSSALITLTAFELGELEIPAMDVEVTAADGSVETLVTDRFGVEVVSVGADESGDIRDIRGPLGIPLGVARVGLWALALLMAAWLAYTLYARMRRASDDPVAAPGPPPRPPHEIALEALARLEASPMLERGQVKEYHIEVSDILRHYVEGRFHVTALEMTTWEVLAGLERVNVEPGIRDRLRRFLEQCDLVKFAKVRPDLAASREALVLGRTLVEETRPTASAGASDDDGPEREPAMMEARA